MFGRGECFLIANAHQPSWTQKELWTHSEVKDTPLGPFDRGCCDLSRECENKKASRNHTLTIRSDFKSPLASWFSTDLLCVLGKFRPFSRPGCFPEQWGDRLRTLKCSFSFQLAGARIARPSAQRKLVFPASSELFEARHTFTLKASSNSVYSPQGGGAELYI